MLSHHQKKKDLVEAVAARRAAAAKLREAISIIDEAIRKLAYNKSNSILFELKQLHDGIKENAEMLEDPEYDPD
ncbi:hypothetical protein ABHN11_21910 [Brevibacillus centrosporus]|jgi:hypothetical protein|uniref:hypothetical protein n=1 Tax=Brevibacillus centrosporus TaxID=54910 RepID=UPI0039872C23